MNKEFCHQQNCRLLRKGCQAPPEGAYYYHLISSVNCRHRTCPDGKDEAVKALLFAKFSDLQPTVITLVTGEIKVAYPFGTDEKPIICGRLVCLDGTIITQDLAGNYYQSPQNAFSVTD